MTSIRDVLEVYGNGIDADDFTAQLRQAMRRTAEQIGGPDPRRHRRRLAVRSEGRTLSRAIGICPGAVVKPAR